MSDTSIERERRGRRWALAAILTIVLVVSVAVVSAGVFLDSLAWSPRAAGLAEVPPGFILQADARSCGPTALHMALASFGISSTVEELGEIAGMDAVGTTLLGLRTAAREKGLLAEGVRVSWSSLLEMPMPVLAHVKGNHYVLVRSAADTVVVDDPAIGRLTLRARTFRRHWDGVVLTLERSGVEEVRLP